MKAIIMLITLLIIPAVAAAFAPSNHRCFRSSTSISSSEESQPDTTTVTIQSNPFLPLLSEGLRRTSIATNKATSDQIFASSSSLQRMRQQVKQLTKVGPSSLGEHAGKGLFATKNIKAGTIVGLYPAHALGYELVAPPADGESDEMQDLSMFIAGSNEDEIYFQANPHGNSPYLHATDQPLFQRQSLLSSLFDESKDEMTPPLYLDVNPNRNDELDGIWTSHFINDGSSLLNTKIDGDSIEQYYFQSTKAKNCCHIPFGPSPILATITTKKVKKGEELFTSYGVVYWLGSVEDPDDDSDVAVMTEKIQEQIVESARDLQKAMALASTGYANESSDLDEAFNAL
mmetsp:Transcript_4715/g.7282  ORF Transcript_4715/g.7282 Transcript_4715/m.7282 type:complete len:344 (+) Transcript_4715:92-1123(+)